MNKKIIGIILIIAGVALVAWGYNIYDSAGSQVTRVLNGDTPIEAWAGMVGGLRVASYIGITSHIRLRHRCYIHSNTSES